MRRQQRVAGGVLQASVMMLITRCIHQLLAALPWPQPPQDCKVALVLATLLANQCTHSRCLKVPRSGVYKSRRHDCPTTGRIKSGVGDPVVCAAVSAQL
jgi:hypothetical protein